MIKYIILTKIIYYVTMDILVIMEKQMNNLLCLYQNPMEILLKKLEFHLIKKY